MVKNNNILIKYAVSIKQSIKSTRYILVIVFNTNIEKSLLLSKSSFA